MALAGGASASSPAGAPHVDDLEADDFLVEQVVLLEEAAAQLERQVEAMAKAAARRRAKMDDAVDQLDVILARMPLR